MFKRSGSGYDTNQNYVNDTRRHTPPKPQVIQQQNTPSPVPQPVQTATPVVISVQLPDGQLSVNNSPVVVEQTTVTTETRVVQTQASQVCRHFFIINRVLGSKIIKKHSVLNKKFQRKRSKEYFMFP